MTDSTGRERQLLEKANQYLPGGTGGNTNFPPELRFLAREGRGAHLWDVAGNRYVDWLMGSGPMILGHAHPAVTEAVTRAVAQGSTFFTTNESAVLLAEELVNAIPCAEKVRFTTSGTDACFQAMRICRAFTGRERVLKFEGGFHGTSDYALMSVTPPPSLEYPQAVPNSGGIPKALQELMLVAPFNDLETTTAVIETHHQELAAVIVEPLQRVLAPEPGFLEGLREVTQRVGVPLIFDEVVTAFRLGYGGAQERYGVVPDLCAVGKIMGGGYPLAAVLGRSDIMAMYDQNLAASDDYVNQIGTLNGNPVACAAGLATLAELRKDGAYAKLRATGEQVRQALVEVFTQRGIAVQSVGDDTIFDVYFCDRPVRNYRDSLTADGGMLGEFNAGLLRKGILKSWPQKFYPSLAHTEEDIGETIAAFEAVAAELAG